MTASSQALAAELDGLFNTRPRLSGAGATRAELPALFDRAIDGADRELLVALATDPDQAARSVIDDLEEIFTLPREARREYAANRERHAPWVFPKLMLEYAVLSRRVDALVGRLNKRFCATRCHAPPVGCCHVPGYDLGLVPEGMLRLQEIEARRAGWSMPPREINCRYHTPRGCALALFKSPACVGTVCDGIVADLTERYTPETLAPLLEALADFRNRDIDRSEVFVSMQRLLAAGAAVRAR